MDCGQRLEGFNVSGQVYFAADNAEQYGKSSTRNKWLMHDCQINQKQLHASVLYINTWSIPLSSFMMLLFPAPFCPMIVTFAPSNEERLWIKKIVTELRSNSESFLAVVIGFDELSFLLVRNSDWFDRRLWQLRDYDGCNWGCSDTTHEIK